MEPVCEAGGGTQPGGCGPSGSGGALRSLGPLALVPAVAGAAVVLSFGPVRGLPGPAGQVRLPWPALAVLFAVAVVLRVPGSFVDETYGATAQVGEARLGPDHPDTMQSRQDLAAVATRLDSQL